MERVEKDIRNAPLVAEFIKKEKIVCCPTDTLYGLIGSALSRKVHSEIYRLKGRNPEKPLIVLFKSLDDAEEMGVLFPKGVKEKLEEIYPERLTVILPLRKHSPLSKILERNDVAIRIPEDPFLLKVMELSTPLFAPSANPEGKKPAENCRECFSYFRNQIHLCVEGKTSEEPSTIISLLNGKPELVREGAIPFNRVKEVLR